MALFADAVDPEQIEMLARVLDDYCREHLIEVIRDREKVASLIMNLFQSGVQTADTLRDALGGASGETMH